MKRSAVYDILLYSFLLGLRIPSCWAYPTHANKQDYGIAPSDEI